MIIAYKIMMFPKTLAIILASCVGGVILISVAMLSASAWEMPGQYSGTNNAASPPSSTTNCYSFQTGCKNINSSISSSDLDSGAYLSSNYHQ